MLLERYALMKNQLVVTKRDARSDLDAVPADELSNFGAAYTVADLQAFRPPQVLFTANSDGSSDDPRTWWGKFRLDLGFSVPPNCWNTGREIRNHKACEAGPVTTLRWVSTSKKTNHNDGATCTQWAPTAAPTRAPTAAPTATPTAPTLAPTLAPSLTHSPTVVWNDGIGDFACTERLLQVLKPEGEDNFDVVEYSGQVVGATTFNMLYPIPGGLTPGLNNAGQLANGFAMHHAVANGAVVNTPHVAVQKTAGSGKAQLCVFDSTRLSCYLGKTFVTDTLPTAAAIIGDTYFYADGSMVAGSFGGRRIWAARGRATSTHAGYLRSSGGRTEWHRNMPAGPELSTVFERTQ